MKEFIDNISGVVEGTPINRANMMAIQNFIAATTVIGNGKITETNSDGHTLETTFSVVNGEHTITQVFTGDKVITKTCTYHSDGSVTEVLT